MGKKFLLDTNTVLNFIGDKLSPDPKLKIAEIIDDVINISFINKIELLGFSKVEQSLIDFVNCSNVIAIDDDVVEKTFEIWRNNKIKLPDAVIAATAIFCGLVLLTNNTKDFNNRDKLEVVNTENL